jgi:adenylate kinase family enzyme
MEDETATTIPEAVLLLGPTGSGKTPLGQLLEARGLHGRRCRHFDFGENLREIVARDAPDGSFTVDDVALLRRMVREGLLLEDEHFPLAARILRRFLAARRSDSKSWIILNGLPRHLGQAHGLEGVVDVRAVVCLACSAQVVSERIRGNAGGDRSLRDDDAPESVRRKLAIFTERTTPLLRHYQSRRASLQTIEVGPRTTAEEMWRAMESFGLSEV